MTAAHLNFLGLIVSGLSAVWMIYAPPRVRQFTPEGQLVITVTSNALPEGAARGRLQAAWWLGPLLLLIGFALQIPAAWIALG